MSLEKKSANLDESRIRSLREQAAHAAKNAYAPYSHFHVGAALLLEDGHVITGCNVENASYRLTTCAEQTAIARAVAEFGPAIRIQAVAVANLNATACQPCGACRQTIHEFSTPNTVVFFPSENGTNAQATMADLLPAAFLLSK